MTAQEIATQIAELLKFYGYRFQVTYDGEVIVTNHPYITMLGKDVVVDEAKVEVHDD